MEKLRNKVAVVTGASSGIGAAIAEILVQNGMIVVGLARREERLKEMESKLTGQKGKFYGIKTDVRKEEDILQAFHWLEKNLGGVQVLINNAGLSKLKQQSETPTEVLREIYDVNVIALQICSREALKSMKTHNIDDGYIINISSIAAHVSNPHVGGGNYYASKKAVNAIGSALREELGAIKSNIRVTTISPGVCDTEFCDVMGVTLPKAVIDIALKPSDIADTVLYVLQLKPHILISELVIQTTVNLKVALAEANFHIK